MLDRKVEVGWEVPKSISGRERQVPRREGVVGLRKGRELGAAGANKPWGVETAGPHWEHLWATVVRSHGGSEPLV